MPAPFQMSAQQQDTLSIVLEWLTFRVNVAIFDLAPSQTDVGKREGILAGPHPIGEHDLFVISPCGEVRLSCGCSGFRRVDLVRDLDP